MHTLNRRSLVACSAAITTASLFPNIKLAKAADATVTDTEVDLQATVASIRARAQRLGFRVTGGSRSEEGLEDLDEFNATKHELLDIIDSEGEATGSRSENESVVADASSALVRQVRLERPRKPDPFSGKLWYLAREYRELFDTCDIQKKKRAAVILDLRRLVTNRALYESVESKTGVPWYVTGVIHNLEANFNPRTHLHNGDPLSARTVHVPKERPARCAQKPRDRSPYCGDPPFKWDFSAMDAFWKDDLSRKNPLSWTLEETLFRLEKYNGFGYRKETIKINSPYLWSGSQHYTSGKFGSDGKFDPTLPSKQVGAAVLLKALFNDPDAHVQQPPHHQLAT